MHYLICDLNIQKKGHYIGYNQYILNNIALLEAVYPDRVYSFLYNSEAKQYLDFPEHVHGKVHFLDDNCWSNHSMKRKISLFKKVVGVANQLKTDHLLFMDLDQYQFPIFISSFSFNVSGVLFRPHHRITASSDTFSSRISSNIQKLKKIIAEKLLTYTKQVSNIYILNDEDGVNRLNAFHKTGQFKYLPDPIFSYPSSLQKNIQKDTFTFLIFGAINERKNITAILKAYNEATFSVNTELFIVGSADEKYIQYLHELMKELPSINASKAVNIKASFVTNEEMDNYFHEADACLLIYKDFYGSSGLLGRATLHGKKVIGANVGLLKELITKYDLGITCDPNSTEEISNALMKIIPVEFDSENFDSFYRNYSPDTFLKTLLS